MLSLDAKLRTELWRQVVESIESYLSEVGDLDVAPEVSAGEVCDVLKPFDFGRPLDPTAAVDFVVDVMRRYHVHNAHPRYFGLFVPAPTTVGIAADALAAAFNPALGAWSLSPVAVEIEHHLVRAFGHQFGYESSGCDGVFTTGGSEANHTALLTALVSKFPNFNRGGLRSVDAQPVLYASSESHHSIHKAARLCGLGDDSVREVPVDDQLQMDINALSLRVDQDKAAGFAPFLIVATAGTTGAGTIDPLASLADYGARERLWLHVDAAWGGAAVVVPELKGVLDGIARADSITFDMHKWLSVPMGAGLYLTRHAEIMGQTFGTAAPYMPPASVGEGAADPYAHSMQWARRFIGLKVFLSLAVAGWEGYAESIRHQVAMGEYLRLRLEATQWDVVNRTPLPLVCFVDSSHPDGRSPAYLNAIAGWVVSSGRAWISTTTIGGGVRVLRACVTNYKTQTEDVDILVEALQSAREQCATFSGHKVISV
jgi:glutamate/tyrosine decarboxylase-like PLP-dependent enzyme